MATPDLVSFSHLCDVPVHWGSWGRTDTRRLAQHWKPELETALDALFACWPWGRPDAILSGGAYVPKAGRHSHGTAFDLCGFAWSSGPLAHWMLADKWNTAPKEAIAVEALLRLHLPQVLGPQYWERDKRHELHGGWRHRGHYHVDDREDAKGFQPRHSSDVRWTQWNLNEVWRPANARALALDGRWGTKTARALATALEEIGEPAVPMDGSVWQAFLEATWRGVWGRVEAPTPR